ncbi:amino acid synthesis family protein [Quadrisphaera granulorum]|nr:amino acid synthesis family protein [Quadrisphaera granulorum]
MAAGTALAPAPELDLARAVQAAGAVLRKVVVHEDEVLREGGLVVDGLVRRVAAAAVIRNPWVGRGHVADLAPAVAATAPLVARALAHLLLDAAGGAHRVEAFGKAVVVGLDGEAEHGAAFIHTPYFGDVLRWATEGTSIIAFSEARGDAGETITVPMWHKTAAATRSHYQSVQVRVPDAPRRDELVLVAAVSTSARPRARIGDRTTDAPFDPSDPAAYGHGNGDTGTSSDSTAGGAA